MNRYAIEMRAVKTLKPLGIAFFMLIAGSLVPPLDEISFDA